MGWALGRWAGPSDGRLVEKPREVATIEASSTLEKADHLTNGFAHLLIHEAIAAPTVSHQQPLLFFAIIATVWTLIGGIKRILLRRVFYVYFAWIRRLFGHQISINAP
ncbi:hypothetical protein GCM10028803_27010 [Larkinella knui]